MDNDNTSGSEGRGNDSKGAVLFELVSDDGDDDATLPSREEETGGSSPAASAFTSLCLFLFLFSTSSCSLFERSSTSICGEERVGVVKLDDDEGEFVRSLSTTTCTLRTPSLLEEE